MMTPEEWNEGVAKLQALLAQLQAAMRSRGSPTEGAMGMEFGLGALTTRGPTPEEIQAGIDATMRQIIMKDAHYNPNELRPPENVRVAGSPVVVDADRVGDRVGKGTGWQRERSLELPPGQDVIERLADFYQPHAPGFRKKPEGQGDA
jgi:hypothetical protein